jgi:hypothetical protein
MTDLSSASGVERKKHLFHWISKLQNLKINEDIAF